MLWYRVGRYTRLLKEGKRKPDTPDQPVEPVDPELGRAIVGELREMMAESKGRRVATGTPAPSSNMPDLIVIDGGKGQLNAACQELRKLGLDSLPIIGLAKEFEEIHRPGHSSPLRLGQDNSALKLLQRIRDESHRVANSYNAQLRLRRISESVLDEFPGIGESRKTTLLKRFGSIQRLRLATEQEIADVPGFGPKSAAELKRFLEARSPRRPNAGSQEI